MRQRRDHVERDARGGDRACVESAEQPAEGREAERRRPHQRLAELVDAQQPPHESRTAPARRRCGVDDRRSACKPPRVSKRVHADEIAADGEEGIGQRRDRGDHRVFDEVERRVARVAPACARDDARKRKHHARRHADERALLQRPEVRPPHSRRPRRQRLADFCKRCPRLGRVRGERRCKKQKPAAERQSPARERAVVVATERGRVRHAEVDHREKKKEHRRDARLPGDEPEAQRHQREISAEAEEPRAQIVAIREPRGHGPISRAMGHAEDDERHDERPRRRAGGERRVRRAQREGRREHRPRKRARAKNDAPRTRRRR